MLLKSLTLTNFGLFRGEQTISLHSEGDTHRHAPIILFGGLNGAGKTTLLTAIRLAIYGKQAAGNNIGVKAYEDFLTSKIYRDVKSAINPTHAAISLEFAYFKLGKQINYKITRSWQTIKNKCQESLVLLQDSQPIPEFTQEQCQAFLNELIPLGVSELFFFDGEKIASLADEGGDVALREAIQKLLGLDIVERLQNDLSIYNKRQKYTTLPSETIKLLGTYQNEYQKLKALIAEEDSSAQQIAPEIATQRALLARRENNLASKGGAWAVSRQSLNKLMEKLNQERNQVEAEIREHLSTVYPLSLAPKLLCEIKAQLSQERELKEWESVSSVLNQRIEKLYSALAPHIPEEKKKVALHDISNIFTDIVSRPSSLSNTRIVHDLSNKDYAQLEQWIGEALSSSKTYGEKLYSQIDKIETEIHNIGLQLHRAPDQDSVKEEFQAIKQTMHFLAQLIARRNVHLEKARNYTWQAIEQVRKIKKAEESLLATTDQDKRLNLAEKTRNLLADFSIEMTKRKIAKLEQVFSQTFSRLMRKQHTLIKTTIDPHTFEVTLLGEAGKNIPKKDLSAGEKQIYAIAMLEALAITSGRKLPIIIDTPLGRLDSQHREKIVHHYFPSASHQVIILSTDTEIDNGFYDDLSEHIGRSYRIHYDEDKAASTIQPDYFWEKINKEAIRHAS
ncbi:DNA sulfur modification protein DndD [Methylobacillus gramineus]|uniref:DNA sulfur modification protein DndD n=1 Tax=Methylobacillus gramineus TaxID=755169 RepID=UPI001CFF9E75|nr:DNA sulfur modification protein DndD [Methylobacillus gramineus]MCB5186146.1 DNA sulfur modification protein DndD [Methylobacillus gramineus]